jgi:hypothetical protein
MPRPYARRPQLGSYFIVVLLRPRRQRVDERAYLAAPFLEHFVWFVLRVITIITELGMVQKTEKLD